VQRLIKKELQTSKCSVIFQYNLLQHQYIFTTYLLSCLFLEKKFSVLSAQHTRDSYDNAVYKSTFYLLIYLLSFKPCFNNSFKQFIICKPSSMKMTSQISVVAIITNKTLYMQCWR